MAWIIVTLYVCNNARLHGLNHEFIAIVQHCDKSSLRSVCFSSQVPCFLMAAHWAIGLDPFNCHSNHEVTLKETGYIDHYQNPQDKTRRKSCASFVGYNVYSCYTGSKRANWLDVHHSHSNCHHPWWKGRFIFHLIVMNAYLRFCIKLGPCVHLGLCSSTEMTHHRLSQYQWNNPDEFGKMNRMGLLPDT